MNRTVSQTNMRSLQTEAIVALNGTDFGHFVLNNPLTVSSYGVTAAEHTNSCEYYNLKYYFATSTSGQFGYISPTTGLQTIIATGNHSGAIAFNPVDNTMYGLSLGYSPVLYTIDPVSGVETQVIAVTTEDPHFLLAMTITNDGRFLMVDATANGIAELNPVTGELTMLIPVDFTVDYAQDIAVDRETNTVFWASYNADNYMATLYTLDLEADTLSFVGYFPTQASAFSPLNYTETDLQHPAAVSYFTATGDPDYGLSVELTWINPTLTIGGEALTSLTSVELYRDGELLHSFANPTIGGSMTFTDTTIAENGSYVYTIYAVNNAGVGADNAARISVGGTCEYTIEMYDYWGDGWNGAAIDVYADTALIGTASFSSGTDARTTIALPVGECSFVWRSGNYDDECYFGIYDPFGILIFSCFRGGAPAAGDFLTLQNTCFAPQPFLNPEEVDIHFSAVPVGTDHSSHKIRLSTFGLTSNITAVTAPPFEVSSDNETFSTTTTIATTGAFEQPILYVRFVPTEVGDFTGTITISSDNTNDTTVAVTGNSIICDEHIGTIPYTEDFEGGIFPPGCWTLESNNSYTWRLFYDTYTNSTWAACPWDWEQQAQQDEKLVTNTIDLTTNLTSIALTFDFYTSYHFLVNPNPAEQHNLLIYASTDNGNTFSSTPIYDMRNDQGAFEEYTVTHASVDLTPLLGETNVKLMFNYYGRYGADLWIDNIMINESYVGIEEETEGSKVSIHPNPATTVLNVEAEGYSTVEILNLLGQSVYSANATSNMQINISGLKSGVYFVRLHGDNGTTTQKFIKR
ncbi:MAG: T9SS type A sorting domain-containing protein [Bacteroidales bacterium]|nr:T9SS type A sorting domain-containing protein [Bacteroidales bacterium]